MRGLALGTALLTLAACANRPTPVVQAPSFVCPPEGVSVTYGVAGASGTVTWQGADPTDPIICPVTITNRGAKATSNRLYGMWPTDQAGIEELRTGLAGLYPLAVGKDVTFSRPGVDTNKAPVTLNETLRVVRQEPIAVGDQTREAFVVERSRKSTSGAAMSGDFTLWFDTATGVLLKQEVKQLTGPQPRATSFAATAFKLPEQVAAR